LDIILLNIFKSSFALAQRHYSHCMTVAVLILCEW